MRDIATLRLHVLASGSKGNSSVVENVLTGGCIVIDCGISKKAFLERLALCGVDPASIEAILLTHEHSDHTKGLGVLTRGLSRLGIHPALYVSEAVHAASTDVRAVQDVVDIVHFKAEDDFALAGISVHAFPTSHDAVESFGFRFDAEGDSIGFMTDTGIPTGPALEALRSCRILALESNHDIGMLEHGPYPAYLKARIASDRGHLSNIQSASLVQTLLDDKVQCLVGMHVSQNNNTYRLPREVFSDVVARNDHPAGVYVGYQDRVISV